MKILIAILTFVCGFSTIGQNKQRSLSVEDWRFTYKNKSYPAKVPGTIHTDLLSNNLIADPFFGSNEKDLQWIDKETWTYETTFQLSPIEKKNQTIELLFSGLDTYATVILNGTIVMNADNMFRTWKVNAGNLLVIGTNSLKVIFKPVSEIQKGEASKLPYSLPESHRVFSRKAQYHFGWDWGPKFLTCGIWKPVFLNFSNNASIDNVRYEQKVLTNAKAELEFIATIFCNDPGNYLLKVNSKSKMVSLNKGINNVSLPYLIKNPKRWWCNGLGEPNLYSFDISLHRDKNQMDFRKMDIGLRTIELIQKKDDVGESFYFKVNGVPVFMKGANYIPPDSFLPRVADSVYTKLVSDARLANMNMLRVWGGGVYADDAFYNACDRNGILVWQDFMFACAMYPGDKKFLENVKREVIDNVNRIQNHASLAIWCGNNENDEGWHNWGWQKQFNYSKGDSTKVWSDYKRLFHEMIPQTLDSLDSKRKTIYWPSSPSIGWGRKESMLKGDSHYWGVWWGNEPFEAYEKKIGRFMSEYGFQGMPSLESIKKFAPTTELHLNSPSVKSHQKHPTGFETINTYMSRDFVIPNNFDDHIYVSQLLQAAGMKTAIEAHRRNKPYCMGSLYWQLNDCWPVTSWSSIDYYGSWKAFHFQAKRSFENVLVSGEEKDGKLSIFIVNDNLKQYDGILSVELKSFDGNQIWSKSVPITVESNSSKSYLQLNLSEFEKNRTDAVFYFHFNVDGKKPVSNLHFLEKPKALKLSKPTISIKWVDAHNFEISTDVLAKNVFLSASDISFDDNYFDLLPGEKKIISATLKTSEITVKSLFDTL